LALSSARRARGRGLALGFLFPPSFSFVCLCPSPRPRKLGPRLSPRTAPATRLIFPPPPFPPLPRPRTLRRLAATRSGPRHHTKESFFLAPPPPFSPLPLFSFLFPSEGGVRRRGLVRDKNTPFLFFFSIEAPAIIVSEFQTDFRYSSEAKQIPGPLSLSFFFSLVNSGDVLFRQHECQTGLSSQATRCVLFPPFCLFTFFCSRHPGACAEKKTESETIRHQPAVPARWF